MSAATPAGELMTVDGAPSIEIRRVADAREMQQALELRHDVFCLEQGVPEREELDGRDGDGIHLIAVRGGEVLAVCRLLMVGATGQFSRLAVRSEERRHGLASALLRQADREAMAAGGRRMVLHAQTYARPLYERAGYVARGRVFVEAGIEHVAMEKVLDPRSALGPDPIL